MKIAFVIQKIAGLTGGAERVFSDTATAMRERGFDVEIVTFERHSGPVGFNVGDIPIVNLFPFARSGAHSTVSRSEKAAGLQGNFRSLENIATRIPNIFPITLAKWQITHGFFIRCLRRYIRRERPNVLIPFMPYAITACAYAARDTNTSVIASIHNMPERDFGASERWDQNPIYRRRSRAALRLVDRILVLLPEFRDWFPAELRDQVLVMPNPIRRLSAPPSSRDIRTQTVLGVGRLTRIKRFDVLIRAWFELGADASGWKLRILGDGPELSKLRALVDELDLSHSVTLAGVVQQIGEEYDQAMILCHPAEFEGFGLAVAEALAHGVPAVAFCDCAGVNTLIDHGRNGLLVDSETAPVHALASALRQLMADPIERERMAAQAIAITKEFTPDRIYGMWESVIKEVSSPK